MVTTLRTQMPNSSGYTKNLIAGRISAKILTTGRISGELSSKYEEQVLTEDARRDVTTRFQSVQNWVYNGEHLGESFLGHYIKFPSSISRQISLLEDVLIFAHHLILSKSVSDRYVAVVGFCKHRGSRLGFTSILTYIVADLFGSYVADTSKKNKQYKNLEKHTLKNLPYEPQSLDEDNIFAEARKYLGCYDKLKETIIYKKLHKLLLYILTLGMLEGVNIDFQSVGFSDWEEKVTRRTHKPGVDMVHCLLDTVCFIGDRGVQYFKSGDYNVIFHSGRSYEAWIFKSQELIRLSNFLCDPQSHNIEMFKYLSDLKSCIEKGSAIVKFTAGLDKAEKTFCNKVLNDLMMLDMSLLSKKLAQAPRKDPFAVLIHGSSSICKSQLKQILFYHYAKCFGLPSSTDFMYTRCPTDPFWSGFTSSQWCIIMDDIAFLRPNGELDPTLSEFLQIKNNVSFCPPQAALEDKGRTPARPELVVATTNTKHLNLHAYFACPFAIARRLQYVVTPHVKSEFTKNTFMADSEKIPITEDGTYMNIWNFDVSIPTPASNEELDNQQTKYVIIKQFTDINDFLVWFIEMGKLHDLNQNKAMSADDTMSSVDVCVSCYRSKRFCQCFERQDDEDEEVPVVVEEPTTYEEESYTSDLFIDDLSPIFRMRLWFISKIISGTPNDIDFDFLSDYINPKNLAYMVNVFLIVLLFSCSLSSSLIFITTLFLVYNICEYFWCIINLFCQYTYGNFWKYRLAYTICGNSVDSYKFLMRLAGDRIKKKKFSNKTLTKLVAFCSLPIVYVVISKLIASNFAPQSSSERMPEPLAEEKQTFYYHDPYAVTEMEISGASKCAQGDVLEKQLRRNTARIFFRFTDRPGKVTTTTAVNICGNIWMINKHTLKGKTGTFDIIFGDTSKNVSRNTAGVFFDEKDFILEPDTDLAFILIRCVSPGHNLIKYFPLNGLIEGSFSGAYHLIGKDGIHYTKPLNNIYKGKCPIFSIPGYHGRVKINTDRGDCGSLCIANIGSSRVLLGTHTCGNADGGVFLQHVSQKLLNSIIKKYDPQVEVGSLPISAPGYERNLTDLHHKSTFRWIENGTAEVMGSFTGYRPRHKSKVVRTAICDSMIKRGYKETCGPPDMSWKPWHLALKDMTNHKHTYYNSVVDECKQAYLDDVLKGIGDQLKNVHVYPLEVALNGMDGITYVDSVNCSTSAGNPFKKSKKNFLTFGPDNKISSVDPLIKERYYEILRCYRERRRYHPQFCNHPKDEPKPWGKISQGKTRIFSTSEFAWNLVVRQYFLSLIRLIQNNPHIFEAMVGIVAQSTDWNELYHELIKHGIDRIIAGDYGKFDKRMVATFILAAFWILIKIAEAAGYTEEDLNVMWCIAYDCVWGNSDFNGDLMEVQGNPSGNPLTVIINCVVNSLYVRYGFKIIVKKPLSDFKKYVTLRTYGDDNIMNVSPELPEFTHTRLAVALSIIGVEYTMADKSSESVPYIHINDSSFLKRGFKFDETLGVIVAPLEHDSFDKMLTSCVEKGNIDTRAHSVQVISTAVREYFFYGKEVFEQKREMFKGVIEENDLGDWVQSSTFPTYENMIYDFWMRSGKMDKANKFGKEFVDTFEYVDYE